MGWKDSHVHEFKLINPSTDLMEVIGIPGEEFEGETEVQAGWKKKVADYFPATGIGAGYIYDLGDTWQHTLEFEGIFPRVQGIGYPLCLDGRRACPPEDCGGIEGFHDFLEAALVLGHKDQREVLAWSGGEFDPRRFDPQKVIFDDPRKRWKAIFHEVEE
jgi:hypothetical protein